MSVYVMSVGELIDRLSEMDLSKRVVIDDVGTISDIFNCYEMENEVRILIGDEIKKDE